MKLYVLNSLKGVPRQESGHHVTPKALKGHVLQVPAYYCLCKDIYASIIFSVLALPAFKLITNIFSSFSSRKPILSQCTMYQYWSTCKPLCILLRLL